jgi:hypothetical protein
MLRFFFHQLIALIQPPSFFVKKLSSFYPNATLAVLLAQTDFTLGSSKNALVPYLLPSPTCSTPPFRPDQFPKSGARQLSVPSTKVETDTKHPITAQSA